MRAVYSAKHLHHRPEHENDVGRQVPIFEVAERAETIRQALETDGGFSIEEPAEHGDSPIEAVHDPGMIRYLAEAWKDWQANQGSVAELFPDTMLHPALREGMGPVHEPRAPLGRIGYWCFETCTPIVEGTHEAARAAVDVALTAADVVLGGDPSAYGLCRPPGHHAARAVFGGYCYLNNAAIATEHLVRESAGRVAILDVDYHHGNGTQQIFYTRPDVLYVSLHGNPDRAYPHFAGFAEEIGAGAGRGTNLNLPLAKGCADEDYLRALDRGLEAIAAFGAAALVVSLGIDTYERDPICDLAITTPAYHEVGRRVREVGLRTAVLQEGGYFVPRLGENVRQWLRGLRGDPLEVAPEGS